jgi:small subunit ribosomal protein S17
MKKIKQTKDTENKPSCTDKKCPFHGSEATKLRGRTFEGEVISKLPGRIKIEFERFLYDKKYERFDKRRTRIHARLPDCLKNEIQLGDWIEIKECRPLSKIIHCIATRKISSKIEKTK